MGRGEGKRDAGGVPRLPAELRRVLPAETAKAWVELAPHLPKQLYLGGGTGVAVYLGHRESRDLDFFSHRAVAFDDLKKKLETLGPFAADFEDEWTLRGLYGTTKLEIFVTPSLKQLAAPQTVAGIRVASLEDLMAMKIKVLAERGEARDYFDVKAIDEKGGVTVEEGIELYLERYGIDPNAGALRHLALAMGDLSDVGEDEALPTSVDQLQDWWSQRQRRVLRDSDRFG